MELTIRILIFALTAAIILAQVPNVYYVFWDFNSYRNWMRQWQSGIFCGIISLAILYYALSGQHLMALGGAGIEIIFNLWYYTDKLPSPRKENDTSKTDWRKKIENQWMAYFIAILMPFMIFIFSMEISKILGGE